MKNDIMPGCEAMIDAERLIKAWEIFRDSNPYQICDGEEFQAIKEPEYCMGQMIEDTLQLLKKQVPISRIEETIDLKEWGIEDKNINLKKLIFYKCGICGEHIINESKFCDKCGQAVKHE